VEKGKALIEKSDIREKRLNFLRNIVQCRKGAISNLHG
jgi:hypothetical protein